MFRRVAESILGLVALAVSALTLWACYDTVANPPDTGTSRATLWAIAYFLSFIALALALFGLRLIIPKLRIEGGHIIGIRGIAAFTFLYGILIVVGLFSGQVTAARLIPPVIVLLVGGTVLLDRLRSRSR